MSNLKVVNDHEEVERIDIPKYENKYFVACFTYDSQIPPEHWDEYGIKSKGVLWTVQPSFFRKEIILLDDNNKHPNSEEFRVMEDFQTALSYPTTSNWIAGSFGIGGFSINCIANYDGARIDFWMSSSDVEKNKHGFDLLFAHKDEIEAQLGTTELSWDRANENKASWITYSLKGVSITTESDWPRMAKFHAEWSAKIADAMIPYLTELNSDADLSPEKAEKNKTIFQLAALAREWAVSKSEKGLLSADLAKCNRTYIRFRTAYMDEIFPDAPDTKSGWSTTNHYFYEIVNRTGKSMYIQLALSSKEMPEDQLETSDRINEFYPSKYDKSEWQWRTPFKTATVEFDDINDKDAVFSKLDECLQEIRGFEDDLNQKIQKNNDSNR